MSSDLPTTSTYLNGLFKPGFKSDEKVVIDILANQPTLGTFLPNERPAIPMFDGRLLQNEEISGEHKSVSQFFKDHGFVLLDHQSAVENWDSGAFGISDAIAGGFEIDHPPEADENEIETRYLPEVERLIKERLLPGRRIRIDQPNQLLRRGPKTAHPFFGEVVHNDYGVTADDYEENIESFGTREQGQQWREAYESDEVTGYMVINFWRTVHMSQPLQHMPLGVLDSSSIEKEDVVSTGLKGFSLTGKITNQLSLRFNANQRWYYYPRMTTEEVLALNLFEIHKNGDEQVVYNSYHSAFPEPNPAQNVEERQSCEHRVNVFLLKD